MQARASDASPPARLSATSAIAQQAGPVLEHYSGANVTKVARTAGSRNLPALPGSLARLVPAAGAAASAPLGSQAPPAPCHTLVSNAAHPSGVQLQSDGQASHTPAVPAVHLSQGATARTSPGALVPPALFHTPVSILYPFGAQCSLPAAPSWSEMEWATAMPWNVNKPLPGEGHAFLIAPEWDANLSEVVKKQGQGSVVPAKGLPPAQHPGSSHCSGKGCPSIGRSSFGCRAHGICAVSTDDARAQMCCGGGWRD